MAKGADWNALAKYCDKLEEKAMTRVQSNYNKALKTALTKYGQFFRRIEDIRTGKIKPPSYVVNGGEEAVKKWQRAQMQMLARRGNIANGIAEELAKAGHTVPDVLKDALGGMYRASYEETVKGLTTEDGSLTVNASFHQLDKRQLDVITDGTSDIFTKIAYSQLENPAFLTKRLQDELYQATLNGESQSEIIRRIRNVTGYNAKRARRIAQTERTTVQSQARMMAGQDATNAGVGVYYEWSCAFIPPSKTSSGSRDTHKTLHGEKRMQGHYFEVDNADGRSVRLRFPGDPSAPPEERINCHCVLIPHVLLPGEMLDDDGNVVRPSAGQQEGENGESGETKPVRVDYGRAVPDGEHGESVRRMIDDAPEFARDAWVRAQGEMKPPVYDIPSGAHFDPRDGMTHYESPERPFAENDYQSENACFFHEYGHNMDYVFASGDQYLSVAYKDGEFGRILEEEIRKGYADWFEHAHGVEGTFERVMKEQNGYGGMGFESYMRSVIRMQMPYSEWKEVRGQLHDGADRSVLMDYFKRYAYDMERNRMMKKTTTAQEFCEAMNGRYTLRERSDISDIYSGVFSVDFGITHPFGVGHDAGYMGRSGAMAKEAFAEMYSATMTGNESLAVIKEHFPRAYALFVEMLRSVK